MQAKNFYWHRAASILADGKFRVKAIPRVEALFKMAQGDLALFHAGKASVIMKEVGYSDEQIARVKQIILKQKAKG